MKRCLSVLVAVLLAAGPAAAATFVIVNLDDPNEGFNDPTVAAPVGGNPGTTVGQQRLNLFQRAGEIWGALLESDVTIRVQARFDPLPCSAQGGVLGGAGTLGIESDFAGAEKPDTWYHIALANKLAGTDLEPGGNDIQATFNSDVDNNDDCLSDTDWYYGFDGNENGDVELLPVLLHELAHGLGFSTFVSLDSGEEIAGQPDVYERFIFDTTQGLHWDEMSNAQRAASATNTGNLVWDGPAVTAASASFLDGEPGALVGADSENRLKLYAPDPIRNGSSISHWDVSATPSLLMEPAITTVLHDTVDLTYQHFGDLGWFDPTVAAVQRTPTRAFHLEANYPNPFNPSTTIAFRMERAGAVKLEVFDAQGRRVRTLLDAALEVGDHGVTWNGRDDAGRTASAGVYLYRLSAADFQESRRMVLLK